MSKSTYVVVAIAVTLLVGACGGTAASTRTLSWHSCDHEFRCATLSVPVSYSDSGGRQIPISVVELVATRPHPIADIVLNPGGPGASGVQFLEQASQTFPASLRARFTLVSFDPRGVGSSEPLQCLTSTGIIAHLGLNPAPRTPRQIKAVVSANKAFVRGCERNASTAFISSMSTANNARDMDRLRAALGQPRLTYLGFSYGTYLGTVYAEMFPKRIRAMVLDGAVDPALGPQAAEAQQGNSLETELHAFFAWCAGNPSCGSFATAPTKTYAGLFSSFEKGRVIQAYLRPEFGGKQPVDYGVATFGVAAALYSKATWPLLGKALSAAESGDGTYLAVLAYSLDGLNQDGSFSNILSANTATSCVDPGASITLRQREALARQLSGSAPDFGPLEAWSGLPCLYWPTQPETQPAAAHAPGAPPILVVGSTGDPATPYAWAKALAKQLPRATLLTRTGGGHTAYRFSSCIRTWTDRYLATLKMPPAGTVCPSD